MKLPKALSGLRDRFRALSLENPNVPLGSWGNLANAIRLWGGGPTDAGVNVDENSALGLTPVWRAIVLIANSIATMPLHVYEEDDFTGRRKAKNTTVYKLLHVQPNPQMTAAVFRFCMEAQALLWGAAYAVIQRDALGRAVALWPLLSSHTKPKRLDGKLWYEYTGTPDGKPVPLKAEDILFIPFVTLDGVTPLSPIGVHRQPIGLGLATERFGAGFFGNGAHPTGVLTTDQKLTPTQQKELLESWHQANGGTSNAGTAVLFGGLKWQQITINPEDAQFLGTRKYTITDVARIYGVPPHMLAELERSTNNNIEQQSLEYLRDCIQPRTAMWTQEIGAKLLSGNLVADFDLDELLRSDFQTMQTGFATGRQWGWFSANDVRRKMNLNPIGPQGDVYMVPLNMIDADSIDQQPEPNGPDETDQQQQQQKSQAALTTMRARIASAARPAFRDAIGRILTRDKRDEQFVARTLQPTLSVLASTAALCLNCSQDLSPEVQQFLSSYAGGVGKRAAEWTSANVESITDTELHRAVAAVLDRAKKEPIQ